MTLVSNADRYSNIVRQTAELRFSVRWSGVRQLLSERGHDPSACLLLSCDQGDDVLVLLVLPDGTGVEAEFREDYQSRQAIRFIQWNVVDYSDPDIAVARSIVSSGDTSPFDSDVQEFFASELQAQDRPLPPLKWGDRVWHHLREPPHSEQ